MQHEGRQTADFFGSQKDARGRSALFLIYFNLTAAVMIAVFYFLAAFFTVPPKDVVARVRAHGTSLLDRINGWVPTGYLVVSRDPWRRDWWQPGLFFLVAPPVAILIYGTAAWRLAHLRRIGGRGIAESLGATFLNRRSPNLADLQFWHTIEEIALAAEMPMPAVYVLEREGNINAFAAGHGPKDAAIGITRGALNLLNRDEIQGIVAHEFSHVVNGDMRLNTRLIGMLHGLVFIADIGERIVEIGLGGEEETAERPAGAAFVVIGNAVQLVGSIGVAIAQIIKAAISRQREFLADAAALQYTRNPAAIGGALRKIAAMTGGGTIRAAGRTAISHAFFCNAVGGMGNGLLSTHPNIVDRILAVDPQWDGGLPDIDTNRLPLSPRSRQIGEIAIDPDRGRSIESRMGIELARVIGLNTKGTLAVDADPLHAACKTTDGAPGLILAMLLPRDTRRRDRVLRTASALLLENWRREALRLSGHLEGVTGIDRLRIAENALPSLRILPPDVFDRFERSAAHLIAADNDIDLFEYALDKLLERHLSPYFRHPIRPKVEFQSIDQLVKEAVTLISIVARSGTDVTEAACDVAFHGGLRRLRLYANIPGMRDAAACSLGSLDTCIQRFSRAAEYVREDLLDACRTAATAHGAPSDAQHLLLRIVADGTDCHPSDASLPSV